MNYGNLSKPIAELETHLNGLWSKEQEMLVARRMMKDKFVIDEWEKDHVVLCDQIHQFEVCISLLKNVSNEIQNKLQSSRVPQGSTSENELEIKNDPGSVNDSGTDRA